MSLDSEFRNDIELHLQGVIETGSLDPALPSRVRHAHRRGAGHRGPSALAAPDPGLFLPGSFIPCGRVHQSGRRSGPLGDANRVQAVQPMARAGHRRERSSANQRLTGAAGDGRVCGVRRRHHRGVRARREVGVPGDHRKRCGSRHRDHPHHPRRPQTGRGSDRHRRLRNRLQRSDTPEVPSGGHAQDRQELRPRARLQPATSRSCVR